MAQASQRRKKSRKERLPDVEVMTGQTEEERRKLRQAQRTVYDSIQAQASEMASWQSSAFEEMRKRNNALFAEVKFNRELGTDGENLAAISEVAKKRSAQLAHSVAQYSAPKIASCLQSNYSGSADGLWLALGREVAPLFRTVPPLEFMCGPLSKPEKTRKVAERKRRVASNDDDNEETQYETVDFATGQQAEKQEEATNERLQRLAAELDSRGARDAPVDVMNLCVNPTSFHQTVENFFDLSFLVKDSKAGLDLDPDTGLPVAALTEIPDQVAEKRQAVVVLSPSDIHDIANAFNITTPSLHRNYDDDSAE